MDQITNNISFSKLLKANPTCFIAGTLVHTKEGLVPIEKIKVGDWVLSKPEVDGDPSSTQGQQSYRQVVRTYSSEAQEVYYLEYYVRETFTENDVERVVVTGSHPICVDGQGWMRVEQLHDRHKLELRDGRHAKVCFVEPVYRTGTEGVGWYQGSEDKGWNIDLRRGPLSDDPAPDLVYNNAVEWMERDGRLTCTVYNIEVEDFHTYYVGESGLWVRSEVERYSYRQGTSAIGR